MYYLKMFQISIQGERHKVSVSGSVKDTPLILQKYFTCWKLFEIKEITIQIPRWLFTFDIFLI